jgi:hypothetical protein
LYARISDGTYCRSRECAHPLIRFPPEINRLTVSFPSRPVGTLPFDPAITPDLGPAGAEGAAASAACVAAPIPVPAADTSTEDRDRKDRRFNGVFIRDLDLGLGFSVTGEE